jgi:hypothetical protein
VDPRADEHRTACVTPSPAARGRTHVFRSSSCSWSWWRIASRPPDPSPAGATLSRLRRPRSPFDLGKPIAVELSATQIRRWSRWQPPVPSHRRRFFASVAPRRGGWRNRRSLPWPAWVQLGLFWPWRSCRRGPLLVGMVLPVTLAHSGRRGAGRSNRVNAVSRRWSPIPVFAVFR